MPGQVSLEQQARDILKRAGVTDAQSFTAGDLVEISNLLNDRAALVLLSTLTHWTLEKRFLLWDNDKDTTLGKNIIALCGRCEGYSEDTDKISNIVKKYKTSTEKKA